MFTYFWIGRLGVSLFDRLVEKRRCNKYDAMIEDPMFLRKEKEIYDVAYENGYNEGYDYTIENKGI